MTIVVFIKWNQLQALFLFNMVIDTIINVHLSLKLHPILKSGPKKLLYTCFSVADDIRLDQRYSSRAAKL